jgi:Glycosyl hydrolase family 10
MCHDPAHPIANKSPAGGRGVILVSCVQRDGQLSGKSNAVYKFVKQLRAQGVPIDGVGPQSHLSMVSTFLRQQRSHRTWPASALSGWTCKSRSSTCESARYRPTVDSSRNKRWRTTTWRPPASTPRTARRCSRGALRTSTPRCRLPTPGSVQPSLSTTDINRSRPSSRSSPRSSANSHHGNSGSYGWGLKHWDASE